MWIATKKINKDHIEEVKLWTEDHSLYCSKIWRVDFHFDHYDPEVKMFYVRDQRLSGREKLEYRHLFDLEEKIQSKMGKRYRLGIIYENLPPELQ
mgnify:CR=1 FL=1|tara:strand:- start:196 stop:480 length:285 start_codon:yes stop_codon:yes gene_type:complete